MTDTQKMRLSEAEAERKEIGEIIERLKAVPRDRRRDIRNVIAGVKLMSQQLGERQIG